MIALITGPAGYSLVSPHGSFYESSCCDDASARSSKALMS